MSRACAMRASISALGCRRASIAVSVPSWRHGAAPEIGASATIGWDPDATVLVKTD
jgi:hypothetical protein